MKKKDLCISIVNYKSADLVVDCIESIYKNTNQISFEIIVVDNNSQDDIESRLNFFPDTLLIKNKKNLGFAAANNIALNYSNAHYFVLLNPDTYLINNALEILKDFMDNNRKCAISCPQLYFPDGRLQQSFTDFRKPFERVMWEIYPLFETVLSLFKRKKVATFKSTKKNEKSGFQEIGRPRGVCFFIRAELINEVGKMDERFFMYCEEVDWAYRFMKKGWSRFICYDAKVAHIGGGTSIKYKSKLSRIHLQSDFQFFYKHFGVKGYLTMMFGILFSGLLSMFIAGLFFLDNKKRKEYFYKSIFYLRNFVRFKRLTN